MCFERGRLGGFAGEWGPEPPRIIECKIRDTGKATSLHSERWQILARHRCNLPIAGNPTGAALRFRKTFAMPTWRDTILPGCEELCGICWTFWMPKACPTTDEGGAERRCVTRARVSNASSGNMSVGRSDPPTCLRSEERKRYTLARELLITSSTGLKARRRDHVKAHWHNPW